MSLARVSQMHTVDHLARLHAGLRGQESAGWLETLEKKSLAMAELHRQERPRLLKQTADGILEPENTLNTLDALRWLNRIAYHTWRICLYLGSNAVSHQPEEEGLNKDDQNP
jgi:phosphate:Na+ symporter